MNIRRIVLVNIIALIVLIAAVYGGYNWYYQNTHYVSTNNAFVEGDEYPINAQFAGNLADWNVKSGDTVTAGQILGTEDTSVELQQLGAAAKDPKISTAVSNAASITSPIDGTILNSTAAAGQMAVPGTPLGYVVDENKLYITANIQETALRNVDVGDTVDISIDAFPGTSFKGTVTSIGLGTNSLFSLLPTSSGASGAYTKVVQTVPVQISISGYAGNRLVPGMSATVQIHRQNT